VFERTDLAGYMCVSLKGSKGILVSTDFV
jgi:hypothetical protein